MPSEEAVLAYNVEYYDEQATMVRKYRLNSFSDGTLELTDLKTKRLFLKRIYCPDVTRNRLFKGSVVNVFGRALEVVDAADLGTNKYMAARTSIAAALIGIESAAALPSLVEALQKTFTAMRTFKSVSVQDLPANFKASSETFPPPCSSSEASMTNAMALVVEVYDESTEAADKLEKLFGTLTGVVHALYAGAASDFLDAATPNAAKRHLEATQTLSASVDPNVTLCLVKPHVVQDRLAGPLLRAIVEAGFLIAGLEQVSLNAEMAHQFYAAYKGVLARYEDIVAELFNGPCIAILLASDVESFRDFCGPQDVKLAATLRPKSLRAKFGTSLVKNGVHCTDLDEDGAYEANFFFDVLAGVA